MTDAPDPIHLFQKHQEVDVTDKVYAQAKYYPDSIKVYIPNEPFTAIKDGFELSEDIEKFTNTTDKLIREDNIERSIRRTKSIINDYVLTNKFDSFATFTFAEDRSDVSKCKSKMANWLSNQRKRKGKFEYLIVPEFHKDKESLHFHALFQNYPGEIRPAINPKTNKLVYQSGRQRFTYPAYTLGFTNVVKIESTPESYGRISLYIRKYITKDMPVFANKNRYWASHNLKLPEKENNPATWYLNAKPDFIINAENGTIFIFERKKIQPVIDIFWSQK